MATNLRINQDSCAVKMRDMQNTEHADYQFFNVTQTSCNTAIAEEDALNLYTDTRSVPMNLIDQESALKGLGVRSNKCGIVCGGKGGDVQPQQTYHPEFCPIISTRATKSHCPSS